MIEIFKKQRPGSVLGLAFVGNRLEAVVLRGGKGPLRLQQSISAPLALSPLSGEPELVGREIRNHLDQAGIRERNCIVGLPLSWVLFQHAQLPTLPEADVASFLQIEAERGFHSGPENLMIVNSRSRLTDDSQFASLMAVPRNHLANLEKALKAAQLKPLAFSLGITSLQSVEKPGEGTLALALGTQTVDMQITVGGGIQVLRSLDAAVENEGSSKRIDAALVAREIRITLGQLPPACAAAMRLVKVFGRGEPARQFVKEISPRLTALGLRVELVETVAGEINQVPPEMTLSPALSLAANWLRGATIMPDLLPPKVNPWDQIFKSKFGSKKLVWAGGAAGAVAAVVAGIFLFQQWQLMRWQSRWGAIEAQVTSVQDNIAQISKYRPWFDESFRGLRILRRLSEAFPKDNAVTAKTIEIRELTNVTCTAVARDNQSYIKVMEQLRAAPEVTDLKLESMRGQTPAIQFTINFQWEGTSSGN